MPSPSQIQKKGKVKMREKTIMPSSRGLTFSFPSAGKLSIGARYDYVIDKTTNSIRISPAETGRYTMSRKKSKDGWNSLVDLRNKEIQAAIADMAQIRISIADDEILISNAKCNAKKSGVVLRFPRIELQRLRAAAGLNDSDAVGSLFAGTQVTFDEYLASLATPVSTPTIHEDLADIYTVVSLFSGAGILDWPFSQDERFRIQYAIDYDEAACKTYRHNIGLHITHGDVHRAFTDDGYPLDDTVGTPDVIIGGPSCKPFSNSNRHTRLEDHPDSDLVLQYMRIVKKLKPKCFAMENVPGVLTACDGAYFAEIKRVAEECGYNIDAKIVQDNKVGGYTTRRRAIVLGSRIGPIHVPTIAIAGQGRTVGDALSKIDSSWSNRDDVSIPGPDTKKRMSFVPQGGNYTSIPEEFQTESKDRHSCTYRRLAWDEPSPTIVNWRKPPLIHPTEDRTLTVAEAKALQGLPGTFKICGSLGQKQQQVGNSVPVAIGKYIKECVLRMLEAQRSIRITKAFV